MKTSDYDSNLYWAISKWHNNITLLWTLSNYFHSLNFRNNNILYLQSKWNVKKLCEKIK